MPRKRVPHELQKGNLTVMTNLDRIAEEKSVKTGKNQMARAPSWLIDDVARAEWKRVTKELKKINIVGNLDINNIGGYCNAFANYVRVTEALAGEPYYIQRITRTGEIIVKNPLIDIQTRYAEEMRKFGALCGMSIDSRLKAAATKTKETESKVDSRFGAI